MKTFKSVFLALVLTGCAEAPPTFSILPETDEFSSKTVNNKVDILWVIDNSGSMQDEQDNLAANFNSFIGDFATKGYDYRIGVTVSDAYRSTFLNQPTLARLRDGVGSTHSGVFVITPNTPNVIQTFVTNIRQGTSGSGDERAFSSFKTALNSNLNTDFRRAEAYLAVVIVSDEDDFSHDSSTSINRDYNHPNLHTVQSYVNYLDQLTQSTGSYRRYSVSAITIPDQACLNINSWGVIGTRYMQLANATGGVIGDICSSSFATDLERITDSIIEASTEFFLSRQPIESTIRVWVNNVEISRNSTNGWSYDATKNSIRFHGDAAPAQGASIRVYFDPASIL